MKISNINNIKKIKNIFFHLEIFRYVVVAIVNTILIDTLSNAEQKCD